MIGTAIRFFLGNRLVVFAILFLLLIWGAIYSPFDLSRGLLPRDPVSVDAIPDIGENQQIVFTEWPGQSPQDVEDQITYPLTFRLMGVPGVKTVRASSMFGFSSIYVIFEDDVEFYWSRSRILEQLNALPPDLLPDGTSPKLGPDATGLGQIFWYTLEGRDSENKITGGWDLHEIRTVQDYFVRTALASVEGVSEVASIGGYVREYQVDINPEKMRQFGIPLTQVVTAIRENNRDAGAKTVEINNVEYFVRGLGYISSLEDIENIAVSTSDFKPILIKEIAHVTIGPAERRGILDKGGAEVAGGIVVSRYGANPMEVIREVRQKISDLESLMPVKTLADGTRSRLTVVPFYDRSELIGETLDTLGDTLLLEILITVLVVIVFLSNLRTSLLISSLMPVVVLVVFISMKWFHVEANILALSGIAIAIGTMVDMGIILTENFVRHLEENPQASGFKATISAATREVSGAILTAGLTTIISFIPVFALSGPEGKLFTPLAFTKTVALTASMFVALLVIPPLALIVLRKYRYSVRSGLFLNAFLLLAGGLLVYFFPLAGIVLLLIGVLRILLENKKIRPEFYRSLVLGLCLAAILIVLGMQWRPLGFSISVFGNIVFAAFLVAVILGAFYLFRRHYERNLLWALNHKIRFLSIPFIFVLLGLWIWNQTQKEFMPSLDEGAYLLMPTSMPHAGVSEIQNTLAYLDMAVGSIPEVEMVVGKAGRAESALDPAPLSMYENLIRYKPEFITGPEGKPLRFRVNDEGLFETTAGKWVPAGAGVDGASLIPDRSGSYYRNWRPHIRDKGDIWDEIVRKSAFPGLTSAPKLQPIETRLVMLQTGLRAPMGIKIKGQNLEDIENFGLQLEGRLKKVAGIRPATVFADRLVGKPYLELEIDRKQIARYGLSINQVQETLETAVGGKILTETVEGRERYGIRLRYPRELRAGPDELDNVLLALNDGGFLPLKEVATVTYRKGPQHIQSEDGFLVGYILFDKEAALSEVTAVDRAKAHLMAAIREGTLRVPPGITYEFSGNYENQVRSEKRLLLVIPMVLAAIFLILYLQFRSIRVSLMVFAGVAVAFSGGFLMIGLYGLEGFMDVSLGSIHLGELFQIKTVHLSVAVWVGFIALFGIATDDGVVMATYLDQSFKRNRPESVGAVRQAVLEAGSRRIRPCLMTTATTLLALIPILTSRGKGSDVMVPMAIPCFGGMLMALITLFVVPVLYSWMKESALKKTENES